MEHPSTRAPAIRSERPGDRDAIFRIVAQAFPSEAEARLVDRLRDDGDLTVSLVAAGDVGRLVGHVAFSPVTTAAGTPGLGLAPVAVDEASRCRGIAAALIEEGLSRARKHGTAFAVVLGEPSYYRRFGFEAASRHGLVDEYEGGEAFQVLALRPGGLPRDEGLVRYAAAFAVVDDGS